ncbi:MAG: glycosyltransferase [Chlorogloeopsis fritschii C42_A2020_084]|jgi:glycosyltransferase involved in cell wall biosynthesis|uniref:glycosyltransferase family 2 protein n=1 Tax=Chlorogloeopsis fritschii TaxID=1124 RepID=UPI001A05BA4F|nr:glycosyltransferase [Chlorogloeopsis fritschii]MBF2006064.1 glycosyltransferase [Chlorogloeopsis fritschii C42_A2020_084]
MPKISVCIPTFNRIKLLSEAIQSVLQQSYQDFEIIVCDDGSQDGTPKLISQYTDKRIRYIRHSQHIGKSNNMRSGFKAATSEYFVKFDDDDRLTPNFLERTAIVLERESNVDFVSTDHWIIDINNIRDDAKTQENRERWGRVNLPEGVVNNLLEVVFVKQSFQIGATLFRRRCLEEVGFMRSNWQNCEDNDLFVRLALAGKNGYYLPELLMEYRVHSEQKGLDRAIAYLTDKLRYLDSYNFESEKLECIRRKRLAETRLLLGLRLLEKGETHKGREFILAGKSFAPMKAWTGLGLSLLPTGVRGKAFELAKMVQR